MKMQIAQLIADLYSESRDLDKEASDLNLHKEFWTIANHKTDLSKRLKEIADRLSEAIKV